MAKDMTGGSISKNIVTFSVPVLITTICQTLFSVVDSIMTGRFVDATALGSISCCGSIATLFMILANGFSVGYRIVIGQLFGAKRLRHVRETIYTSLIVMGVISGFISVLGVLGAKTFLSLLNTVPSLMDNALIYLRLYFAGITLIIFRSGINNIYYALGETKIPMVFQICTTVFHIFLDFVLLKYLHLGVAGVAMAGIISRFTFLIPLAVLLFKKIAPLPKAKCYFEKECFGKIVRLGIPSCLAQSMSAIISLAMTRLINSFGAEVVTGNSIANQILNLFYIVTNTVGSAAGSFASQNFGAHNLRRIKKVGRICAAFSFVYSVTMMILVRFFGINIISLYISSTTEPELASKITEYSHGFLLFASSIILLHSLGHICNEILRAVGKIKITVVCTGFSVAAHFLSSYVLSQWLGPRGIYYGIAPAWIIYYVPTLYYFFRGRWLPHFKGVDHQFPELDKNRESLKEQILHIDQ